QDGDVDLYISCGGNQFESGSLLYRDELLINNDGNFENVSSSVNFPNISTSCTRAGDIDQDGDMDILVLGRVDPANYPQAVPTLLFINESKPGKLIFNEAGNEVVDGFEKFGMACDALFTDFNGDDKQDIVIAGEW